MSFEYFNNSHLAFGSKLTKAFKQLEKLMNDAEGNILSYVADLDVLSEYVNRNYRVPRPTSATSPVRASEAFDIINDNYYIKEATYKNNTFRLSINYFNRNTNRFTVASGSTDITDGYAYAKSSMSNSNPASEITFSEKENESIGYCLFRYKIDSQGFINIYDKSSDILDLNIGDYDYENKISLGSSVSLPYIATEDCCVIVVGLPFAAGVERVLSVYIDGKLYARANGKGIKYSSIVYLKEGQKLTADGASGARLVNYTKE